MKIQKIIQDEWNGIDIYGHEAHFKHINDSWSLIGGYDIYHIETHIMEVDDAN